MVAISTPVTPLHVGAAADQQLDHITGGARSRLEVFLPSLRAAHHGYGVPGRMAPPSARGLRAWLDGTEELRLRLEPLGWQMPTDSALDSAGVVMSQDGKVGIALVAGDACTGNAGCTPQVKYARGPVAAEFVQGTLFEGFRQDAGIVDWWYLLHEMTLDGWRAELALPADIKSGWVTRWKHRVQIVADGPDDGMPVLADNTPELPTPTVRWRESA